MTSTTASPRDLANLRDVGELPTVDGGRTRAGVLWRSDAPLDGDLTATVGDRPWPPASVIDLRDPGELRAPHPLVARGAALTSLPVLAALAPEQRDNGRNGRIPLDELYRLVLDKASSWMPELFAVVATAPLPVLVHCAAGKDRTGISVAVLLRTAGVTREAVAGDFAATNRYREALRERLLVQGIHKPHVIEGKVGVSPEHLEAILDRLEPDPWDLPRAAGVPVGHLEAWRERLTGP